MRRRWLARIGLWSATCTLACAGTITDPAMGLDEGSLSDPISLSTTITPINGGGVFGFFNNTGEVIIQLDWLVTLRANLTAEQVAGVFTCNDGAEGAPHRNPFFLHCSTNYEASTGHLTVSFFGTNPLDGDEILIPGENTVEDEVGEQEGIPPVFPGCDNDSDFGKCALKIGHFIITLNDGFSTDRNNPSGGWSHDINPDLFDAGQPGIGVIVINTTSEVLGSETPEPASGLLIGSALAGLAALAKWRRRPGMPRP